MTTHTQMTPTESRMNVAIVGAGVGGMSTAIRLAAAGHRVSIFEKSGHVGGRCGQLSVDGYHFDTGPTLLLMPEVFEETFAAAGRKMSDYLELQRCDPNYDIHFRDGSTLTLGTELCETQKQLEAFEPGSFEQYLKFLAAGHVQYRTSLDRFVGRNFDNLFQFLTPKNIKHVFKVKALTPMYKETSRYFRDDRLRAAFTFQTMYLGISPFEAPAVYGLLPYTELAVGIWFPKGGMYAIAQALEKLCRELGVQFHFKHNVAKVMVNQAASGQPMARGLRLADGRELEFDSVCVNADLPWAYKNLIEGKEKEAKRFDKMKYTSSAYMFYLGTNKKWPQLKHHNIYLGKDYARSFTDIFDDKKVPADASFYINVPSRTDPSLAPAGTDAVYVLVPVPAGQPESYWREHGPKIREHVMNRLHSEGLAGFEDSIVTERVFMPHQYLSELNLEQGSAFGLSHNFMQVGPFRPSNQDADIKNLFFVGASTQPGTGLPMVMLSARLVTERMQTFASQRTFSQPEVARSSKPAVHASAPTQAA